MASEMRVPFIIGEFGSCHEQSLSRAIQGIEVAKESGCDAYKVQFWSSPERMRERRNLHTSGAYEMGSVKEEWLPNLAQVCRAKNILFVCSVFLPMDVELVATYVEGFKVSSFECQDRELLSLILKMRGDGKGGDRPFWVSTGMCGPQENSLIPHECIRLHCVSAYPCPLDQANLGAIEIHEGYSDHTRCTFTGGLAVASGADYLEVHYRLDETNQNCPDYPVSLSPAELGKYVYFARTAALMRGSGEKKVMECEEGNVRHRVTG